MSKDHVHIPVEYPPSLSVSNLVKKLKGEGPVYFSRNFPFWVKNIGGDIAHIPGIKLKNPKGIRDITEW